MKYIPYLLILILSYFICMQYNEIKTLNSKVNSLDYKLSNVNKLHFSTAQNDYKETFYLTQLSNSTTLVLSVIGFALVLAGISSYFLVKERFEIFDAQTKQKVDNVSSEIKSISLSTNNSVDTLRTEISEKLSKYEEKYKKIEHTMYDLKNDFEYELVTLKQNEAKEALSNKNLNGYIFYSLYSFRFTIKCVSYYRKIGSNLSEKMLTLMNNRIESLKLDLISMLKFDNVEKHILPLYDKENIIDLIKEINEVGNTETFNKLNFIYSILEFKD